MTEGIRAIVDDGYLDASERVGAGRLPGERTVQIPMQTFGGTISDLTATISCRLSYARQTR